MLWPRVPAGTALELAGRACVRAPSLYVKTLDSGGMFVYTVVMNREPNSANPGRGRVIGKGLMKRRYIVDAHRAGFCARTLEVVADHAGLMTAALEALDGLTVADVEVWDKEADVLVLSFRV